MSLVSESTDLLRNLSSYIFVCLKNIYFLLTANIPLHIFLIKEVTAAKAT